MKNLETMKEALMAQVQAQMGNLAAVDTKELGEAIDMIKDLAEAIYYCTITEAMNDKDEKKKEYHYFYPQAPTNDPWHDGGETRMYYKGMGKSGRNYYEYPIELRDHREGQSPKARRMYMESKEMHHDKTIQMKELEKYMHELGSDISEMIDDATPEERELLKNKLMHLVQKIDHN